MNRQQGSKRYNLSKMPGGHAQDLSDEDAACGQSISMRRCVFHHMPCWKWFNNMLEEAGVEVTEANRERIDAVIHDYIEERSANGKCSRIPSEASGQIAGDRTLRNELLERLKLAAEGRAIKE